MRKFYSTKPIEAIIPLLTHPRTPGSIRTKAWRMKLKISEEKFRCLQRGKPKISKKYVGYRERFPFIKELRTVNGNIQVLSTISNKWIYLHTELWKIHYGEYPPKGYFIIHKDGIKTNFDISNLSIVEASVFLHQAKTGLTLDVCESIKLQNSIRQILTKRSKENGRRY